MNTVSWACRHAGDGTLANERSNSPNKWVYHQLLHIMVIDNWNQNAQLCTLHAATLQRLTRLPALSSLLAGRIGVEEAAGLEATGLVRGREIQLLRQIATVPDWRNNSKLLALYDLVRNRLRDVSLSASFSGIRLQDHPIDSSKGRSHPVSQHTCLWGRSGAHIPSSFVQALRSTTNLNALSDAIWERIGANLPDVRSIMHFRIVSSHAARISIQMLLSDPKKMSRCFSALLDNNMPGSVKSFLTCFSEGFYPNCPLDITMQRRVEVLGTANSFIFNSFNSIQEKFPIHGLSILYRNTLASDFTMLLEALPNLKYLSAEFLIFHSSNCFTHTRFSEFLEQVRLSSSEVTVDGLKNICSQSRHLRKIDVIGCRKITLADVSCIPFSAALEQYNSSSYEPLSSSQRESLLQAYRSGTLQNPVALIALAKCRDYQDDLTLTLVQEALKLAPHYSQALYMAAVIALNKGNINEGKSYSEAAMKVDPSLSPRLHLEIGRALHTGEKDVRDFKQARSHYQQVIDTCLCRTHSKMGMYWQARLDWDDAELHGTEGALESAKKSYQKVLEIDPSFTAASFDLAILYMTENNRELARSHFLSFLSHYDTRHELRVKKKSLPIIKELFSLVTKNPVSNAEYEETVKDFFQTLLNSVSQASWAFHF